MNEDGTPIAPADEPVAPVVDNLNSEEGSVTPEEVAQVLGKPVPVAEEPVAPVEPEEPVVPVVEEPAPVVPFPPKVEEPVAPIVAPEAPSFALEVEDANGTKFIINPDDNIDEVLKDFEPKDNGQIFKIIEDRMQLKMDAKAYTDNEATKTAEAEHAQAVANIQSGWDREAEKLQGEKRIPMTVEGKSNERLEAVYKFMAETNQVRIAAGVSPIQTLEDALDKMELQESKAAAAETARKAKEDARARGALVGGSSAPASSGAAPTWNAGTGVNNANQALKSMGLI